MYPNPLVLLCVAGALVAGGLGRYAALRTPARWTADEAAARVHAAGPDLVTLAGALDRAGALYDLSSPAPGARRPPPEPSAGAVGGTPVSGPDAAPRERWPELLGLAVRAPAHARTGRPLTPLGAGLWVLAPSGPDPNGAGAGPGSFGSYGVLRRARNAGADPAARSRSARAAVPADDWVIDEDPGRARLAERAPVHVYVPVRGTGRSVWVRLHVLRGFRATAAWFERVGNTWTGVWLPAGTHDFAPPGAGPPRPGSPS